MSNFCGYWDAGFCYEPKLRETLLKGACPGIEICPKKVEEKELDTPKDPLPVKPIQGLSEKEKLELLWYKTRAIQKDTSDPNSTILLGEMLRQIERWIQIS